MSDEKTEVHSLSADVGVGELGMVSDSRPGVGKSARTRSIEAALTEIWKSLLDIEDVEVDDDFFLLGGDSLLAATLFSEVGAVFGVELPLNAIFDEAATIEGMAQAIENAGHRVALTRTAHPFPSDLVPINPYGTLPALFAVGGNGGHSVGLAHLSRLLGVDQPFYGLDSVGLDGAKEPLVRMEDIASEHIRKLRAFQPEGPYYLIGACFGGRVVYEMAQQMRREGLDVALTILLDPSRPFAGLENLDARRRPSPTRFNRKRAIGSFVLNRMRLYGADMQSLSPAERYRYVLEKMSRIARIRSADRQGIRTEIYREAVFKANKRAGRAYVAQPYPSPVAVFWSAHRPVETHKRRKEWLSLLRQPVTVQEIPGKDSGSMLRQPGVEILAPKIAACLHERRGR